MSPSSMIEPLESRRLLANVPAGFTEAVVAEDLASPTGMAFAPDGRIFIAEKGGHVRVVKEGNLLPTPFVSVGVDTAGERGLIGLALDPQFGTPGHDFVYVHYTVPASPVYNRVSRFTAAGDVAAPGSEQVLLTLNEQGTAQANADHNGGEIGFGPDGKLYITVGDNRQAVGPQSLSNLFGKVLRINPDGSIPTDNPFYEQTTGVLRAIWALGLRNPFSFDFQPGTGRMFLNDVGEAMWEEINEGVAGANYGWPAIEGPRQGGVAAPALGTYRDPFFAYMHDAGYPTGCAITGGSFYNPATAQFPVGWVGDYFFCDFCGGWIKRLDVATGTVSDFASGISFPIDVQAGPDGALYYLSMGGLPNARLHRIAFSAEPTPPTISAQPPDRTVTTGRPVTFAVSVSGEGPFAFQWRRNGQAVPGATSSSYTIDAVGEEDDGALFSVVVSNDHGPVTSRSARLTVTPNQPPVARLVDPVVGLRYRGGQVIEFYGMGIDPEEGKLAGSAFTWRVDFHHEEHWHPFIPETTGVRTGSFKVPRTGEVSPDVWYRVHLTVTDSQGLSHSTYRDVRPRKAVMTFATSPPGIGLTLDGQPRASGLEVLGVVGIQRTVTVPTWRTHKGVIWDFDHWSDGGARTHVIGTPTLDTTYTAVYRVRGGSVGSGGGLTAAYYADGRQDQRALVRRDAAINFDWGLNPPVPELPGGAFSVRWTGRLRAQYSQLTTLTVLSSQGVRLWIDGVAVINDWTSPTGPAKSVTIQLQAGRYYDIRLDYRRYDGDAGVQLLWSSTSIPRSIIPSSQLYA